MIKITLKDGKVLEFAEPISGIDVARSIGSGLAKAACAVLVDGEMHDLRFIIKNNCELSILTFDDDLGKRAYRHSTSHILAQAVKRLFPAAKLAIGPAIENGFYYDFDVETPFTQADLDKIEAEMRKIIKEDLPIEFFEEEVQKAKEICKDEPYKLELIDEHAGKGEKISFYRQGEFVDLCAGPHLMSTGCVKAIKLTSATGAYWRGDANKAMLCRIYGTAFPKQSLLDEHLALIEEAKKRDHRKLGKELELFALLDEGPGFPFFLPNGMILKNCLLDYWRKLHAEAGYVEISTPAMLNRSLWERSGHWYHYKENMYTTVIDDMDFAIKPMNCPGGMLVYGIKPRSYRDLPMRVAELGHVHRHELSGALHGLMRVRAFTQDDAHIYMTEEQIKDEIKGVVTLIGGIYDVFGFKYRVELSTRPEDSMGTDEQWNHAIKSLSEALQELGINFKVNEGDGAFYGPKIDFKLEDSLGRTWQCGTIQLDMQLPERFQLEYTGSDDQKHRPVMIHRAAFGSIERFIGILTEHFAGAFPLWISPLQVEIMPIADRHNSFAEKVKTELVKNGFRVHIDDRSEKIGFKIREAQLKKTPYMLIIGDKEVETETISVRSRKSDKGDLGAMTISDLMARLADEVENKTID